MSDKQHKPAQTSAPIHPLLASRWSPRAFSPQPVDVETVAAMAEAARWTPSCFGAEPWRFVICNKEKNFPAWEKAFACLADGNKLWTKNAQLLVLICAEKAFADGGENRHSRYDTGAAAFAWTIEAENQGLRCHQMGGFDAEAAQNAFGVPDGFECLAMLAAGYQADAGVLESDELRARETAPRKRRPPEESFFDGAWGKSGFGE